MYDWIRCSTCNKSIGEFYTIYNEMKKLIYEEELKKSLKDINISKIELNDNINISTKEIFDILHINNYCCKIRLSTNIEFDSLT